MTGLICRYNALTGGGKEVIRNYALPVTEEKLEEIESGGPAKASLLTIIREREELAGYTVLMDTIVCI